MMRFLGAVLVGLTFVLTLSLIAVPIRAWPAVAPFEAYLPTLAAWAPCIILVFAAASVLAQPRYLVGAAGRMLAVLGLAVAFLWPAYALAQDASATSVNLGGVFSDLRGTIEAVVGVVVAAILALGAALLKKSTGLSIDAKMRETLQGAAMNGVRFGLDGIQERADRTSVDVKSAVIVEGIRYMRLYAPLAIKHFKLSDADLETFLRAKLQEVLPDVPPALASPSRA